MNATLTRADGPADPPSSRPCAGVLGGAVFRFSFDPSGAPRRLDLPGGAVVATPDAVLDWAFYADGEAATHRPHAALACTVDVEFDDGGLLSELAQVRDRYRFPLGAQAQFDAAWSMPEQWNADSVSLAPAAGRSGRIQVVLGAPSLTGQAPRGGVHGYVEVRVRQAPLADPSPAELVDTRRGSHSGDRFSRGNTVPALARPHGFTFVTPATDAGNTRWPYRPFLHDDPQGRRLEAIQFSHQPSPWIGDRGVLQVAPFSDAPASDRDARRRWIVDGTERAHPHLYGAVLDDGSTVEATATDHAAAFRVRADDPGRAVGFVLDQPDDTGSLTFDDAATFHGWLPEGDPGWGNPPRCYFAGVVLTETTGHGPLDDAGRGRVAGHITGLGECEVRVAVSYLSVAQARRSLAAEAPAEIPFDALVADAKGVWDHLLGRITVPPLPPADEPYLALADAEDRARIASALYRLALYPNSAAENTGTAQSPRWRFADPMVQAGQHGPTETGAPVADGVLVVNNGYWDTYRTVWPALAFLDPDRAAALLDGLLTQYRRGGWMARWSAPGYVDSMVGTSSDQIFADADAWGVPLDEETAFDSAWRNACEPSGHPNRGRKGIGRGRFVGHISTAVHEGMSWSLENAVSDAAIGLWAARRGGARMDAFARYFRNRSLSYRALFDQTTGFFRGLDGAGAFWGGRFDPAVWGGDNVETNAWGMSVSAVHDGAGLARLYGGPAALRRHLDALFAEEETADERHSGAYGTVIHEAREARAQRSGMCALSNQPAHHIPWMYLHTDRPWLAAAKVHGLASRLFAGSMIAQGFPGDEDNGEMGAWWLWAALGLYPLELASGRLEIGSPLLDDVTVDRPGGVELRIVSRRSGPGAHVLVGARLDGRPLPGAFVPVRDLAGARLLELDFDVDAARALPTGFPAAEGYSPDLTSADGEPIGSAPDAARAFDDRGEDVVALPRDAWVGWRFDRPRLVTDASLTLAAPSAAWRWEALAGGAWTPLGVTHADTAPAERTLPLRFESAVEADAVRLVACADLELRQIELFRLG